jgi:beta-galactosidase
VDPDCFHADEKTYFRYTRWRATRAVAQLLANLGASFAVDSRIFLPLDTRTLNKLDSSVGPNGDRSGRQATGPRVASEMPPSPKPQGAQSPPYYHPDYRTDFHLGDNPYRYYRW